MIMFEEEDVNWFPLNWTDDPMAINDFSRDYLSETEKEVVRILVEFHIMGYREMVEYNESNGREKKIDNYLLKFDVCLTVVVKQFTLHNVFLFICREDGPN